MRIPPTIALLLAATLLAAAPLASADGEVQLPDASLCTREVVREATSKDDELCVESIYGRQDAVEPCCAILADYYGPNSTRATRHCFCVESYWTSLMKLAEVARLEWADYFDGCTELGYPIYYFQDGKGPCNPAAEVEEEEEEGGRGEGEREEEREEEEEDTPLLPLRSFGGWARGLDSDGWSLAAFIAACVAAVGSGSMAWAFVFDACSDVRRCWGARRAAA